MGCILERFVSQQAGFRAAFGGGQTGLSLWACVEYARRTGSTEIWRRSFRGPAGGARPALANAELCVYSGKVLVRAGSGVLSFIILQRPTARPGPFTRGKAPSACKGRTPKQL